MGRQLVLFTVRFPYGYGESFIEPELNQLALTFPKIIIQPIEGGPLTRSVPENVIVAPPIKGQSKLAFYLSFSGVPQVSFDFFREVLKQTRLARPRLSVIPKIWMWACTRRALERSYGAEQALQSANSAIAYSYWAGLVALAIPMLSARGIPCVVRYHSGDLYLHDPETDHTIPWREDVARASKLSLFISNDGRDYFLEALGQYLPNPSRAIVSRLGSLDYGPGPAPQGSDSLTIVSCSFITFRKRVHLIAKLVREISKRRNVVWHHFGGGDDSTLMRIQRESTGAGMTVKLWGTVPHKDIISFLKANHVDLFVNLSVHEGVPVSIMEAISFGIPAVGTDVGAVREIVISGRSGLLLSLAETEDIECLANRILDALGPDGAIGRSKPREVWAERFDAAHNHRLLAQLLVGLHSDRA
jgi:colanic acid/amylovoran biosynthesis glycosyltransferase